MSRFPWSILGLGRRFRLFLGRRGLGLFLRQRCRFAVNFFPLTGGDVEGPKGILETALQRVGCRDEALLTSRVTVRGRALVGFAFGAPSLSIEIHGSHEVKKLVAGNGKLFQCLRIDGGFRHGACVLAYSRSEMGRMQIAEPRNESAEIEQTKKKHETHAQDRRGRAEPSICVT